LWGLILIGQLEIFGLQNYLTYGVFGMDAFNYVLWLPDEDREMVREQFEDQWNRG
jgi:hypothetical protein